MFSLFCGTLQIVLQSHLGVCVEYIVEGLRVCPQWLQKDFLRALAALLYENVAHVAKVCHHFFVEQLNGTCFVYLITKASVFDLCSSPRSWSGNEASCRAFSRRVTMMKWGAQHCNVQRTFVSGRRLTVTWWSSTFVRVHRLPSLHFMCIPCGFQADVCRQLLESWTPGELFCDVPHSITHPFSLHRSSSSLSGEAPLFPGFDFSQLSQDLKHHLHPKQHAKHVGLLLQMTACSFRGVHNILLATKICPPNHLRDLLSALKVCWSLWEERWLSDLLQDSCIHARVRSSDCFVSRSTWWMVCRESIIRFRRRCQSCTQHQWVNTIRTHNQSLVRKIKTCSRVLWPRPTRGRVPEKVITGRLTRIMCVKSELSCITAWCKLGSFQARRRNQTNQTQNVRSPRIWMIAWEVWASVESFKGLILLWGEVWNLLVKILPRSPANCKHETKRVRLHGHKKRCVLVCAGTDHLHKKTARGARRGGTTLPPDRFIRFTAAECTVLIQNFLGLTWREEVKRQGSDRTSLKLGIAPWLASTLSSRYAVLFVALFFMSYKFQFSILVSSMSFRSFPHTCVCLWHSCADDEEARHVWILDFLLTRRTWHRRSPTGPNPIHDYHEGSFAKGGQAFVCYDLDPDCVPVARHPKPGDTGASSFQFSHCCKKACVTGTWTLQCLKSPDKEVPCGQESQVQEFSLNSFMSPMWVHTQSAHK